MPGALPVGDVDVRRAVAADLDALVDLRARMFTDMGTAGVDDARWRESARAWFAERLDDQDLCLVVVDVAGLGVVASAMGAIRDAAPSPTNPYGRDVLVSNVCTAAASRRQGHARRALDAVMRWARASGVGRAELLATGVGRALYEEQGFGETRWPAMRATLHDQQSRPSGA